MERLNPVTVDMLVLMNDLRTYYDNFKGACDNKKYYLHLAGECDISIKDNEDKMIEAKKKLLSLIQESMNPKIEESQLCLLKPEEEKLDRES